MTHYTLEPARTTLLLEPAATSDESMLMDERARVARIERPADGLEDVLAHRTQVNQAQGMVMLGVTVTDAMVRLRPTRTPGSARWPMWRGTSWPVT